MQCVILVTLHALQAQQLANENDIAAKAKQALGVVGELADSAIIKTVELEKEYKVVDKVRSDRQRSANCTREVEG